MCRKTCVHCRADMNQREAEQHECPPVPDFPRDAIVQALYTRGWTCDMHEPDLACEECRVLWRDTADAILAALNGTR